MVQEGGVAWDTLASPRSGLLPPLPHEEGVFLAPSLYTKDAVLKLDRRPSAKSKDTPPVMPMSAASPPAWWAPLPSPLGAPSSPHTLPPACPSQGKFWVKGEWAVTHKSYGLGPSLGLLLLQVEQTAPGNAHLSEQ